MRNIILTILVVVYVFANEEKEPKKLKPKYDAYNYIAFGFESINYQENGTKSSGESFASDSTADSPVYISGSLIRINDIFDFSIDTASTLFPTASDEVWYQDGQLASTDKLETIISSMKFLGQYKYTDNHRIVLGAKYDLNLYKRHTYKDVDGGDVYDNDGNKIALTEELISTLSLTTGYIYESAPHSSGGFRIKLSAIVGKPIWRNASNTGFKDITYDSTSGYGCEFGGYIGYQIIKGLEIGYFADYDYQVKSSSDKKEGVIWPENKLKVFRSGISFVWNFK
jgi:hypothetical protein